MIHREVLSFLPELSFDCNLDRVRCPGSKTSRPNTGFCKPKIVCKFAVIVEPNRHCSLKQCSFPAPEMRLAVRQNGQYSGYLRDGRQRSNASHLNSPTTSQQH